MAGKENLIMEEHRPKENVKNYWEAQSCGTEHTRQNKYSRQYFDEIENYRYAVEPEIFAFAQFTRFYGKEVLEVGVGAGTDFIQWLRGGAKAYGVDLTEESINNVQARLEVYGLKAQGLLRADAEALPFPDNKFDLVYSWGVIHHTPDTQKALAEIIRVTAPGGKVKIMIYHRHSLVAFYLWLRRALLTARPWKSFAWCLANYMESKGTKAFTPKEIEHTLKAYPIANLKITPILTYYDLLKKCNKLFQWGAKLLAWLLGGSRVGWFMTVEFDKTPQI